MKNANINDNSQVGSLKSNKQRATAILDILVLAKRDTWQTSESDKNVIQTFRSGNRKQKKRYLTDITTTVTMWRSLFQRI